MYVGSGCASWCRQVIFYFSAILAFTVLHAARIQTTYSITMGSLSALTTGWWGHFGERYGRTKVLALATFGWFLTVSIPGPISLVVLTSVLQDVTFILAATPSSPLASYGRVLLLIAPVFEGLLGGWSTLQAGTSAYISDCTSSGSRASVFSRFTGVSFLGFSVCIVLTLALEILNQVCSWGPS